jgi:HK97 family phage prohead protease
MPPTPATTGIEQRWYQLRDIEIPQSLSVIRIRAVPYDTWANIGWFHERFARHSLDKSIKEAAAGLPLLLFHDHERHAIGTSASWKLDDPGFLIGEWDLDTKDERAMEAARKAADGFLNGASIRFQPIRSERFWNDEDGWDDAVSREEGELQVTRKEARLIEVSLTPVPAYQTAGVELVRSHEPRTRDGSPPPQTGMSAQTRRTIADLAQREPWMQRTEAA